MKNFRSIMAAALLGSATIVAAQVTAPTDAAAQAENAISREQLAEKIDAIFDDPRFDNAFWGAVIESLETGEVLYERNAIKMFMPASNEKILTTAASLMTLGPDWTFTTTLETVGEPREGVIEGDLIVTANGDPTLYERFYDESRDVFRQFADELKEQGITKIDGNVVGNDNKWVDSHYDSSWPSGSYKYWYNAEYGPLTLNENYVDVQVIPPEDAEGEVTLEPNMPSDYFEIINNVEVVADGRNSVRFNREFDSNTVTFSGQVEAGSDSFEETFTITNPTLFYVTVLTEVLEESGIEVVGSPVDIDDLGYKVPETRTTLVTHQSAPLSEILAGLMKRSQNMYAENMVRVIGEQETGLGSFRSGREVLQSRLEELGVDSDQYNFSDGSGLSRYNWVSPRALTEILKGMREHEHGDVWYELFPIAGVDGTLRSRMEGTPAEGNVRAKTGTISNVRGLSGYVTTAAGEKMVFSFLVNAHQTSSSATNDVTDGVLELVAGYNGSFEEKAETVTGN